jgi:O-Antigen ligase
MKRRDPGRLPGASWLEFLPALLLGLFGGWAGTWIGGAGWAGSATGEAVLLALGLGAGLAFSDPLRLGRAGRVLPVALWVTAFASLLASPVPRAGRVGVLLLPLFLLLPGIVALCWRTGGASTVGVRSVSAVVGSLSLWALADLLLRGAARAAEPLGHHNLLAAWLVILLPLAVLPAREKGAWRLLGWGSGLLGLAALVASRSLAGAAALAVEVLALLALTTLRSSGEDRVDGPGLRRWPRQLRWGLLVLLLAALATQTGRIGRVLGGGDNSVRVRAVYLQAGWEGFLARPALGWGPGSTPWTAAAFFRPIPGVNPPSEAVGELHSLPVQLAFELGAPGLFLALALAAVFARRRLAELAGAPGRPAAIDPIDPGLAIAGLLGLLGAAIVALASAALAVTALPVAAAVAAGATLAGGRRAEDAAELAAGRARAWRWLLCAYAALALALLLPIRLAARHAERAIGAAPETARQELARAVRLDPAFPLYRARLAWLQDATPLGRAAAAVFARQAAGDAGAVIPLWLSAGLLGSRAGEPWAAAALERACDLDPLSSFAPFYLARQSPASPRAAAWAGRAFLADPRLAAAVAWESVPEVRRQGLAAAARWPGVPLAWRAALADRAADPLPPGGPTAQLALQLDSEIAQSSFSLYLFRRRVSPTRWPITLRAPLAARFDLPPATVLPETRREAFEGPGCGAP